MLICKFKNKPKGWYQVSSINIELDIITYVDDYHNDFKPYAFTTTNLRYIQKIKQVKDSVLFVRNKKKKIDKFRKKLWRGKMNRLTKDIEKYWELEQQLGCDLEVVFKALKEGICVEDIDLGIYDEFLRPRLYFSDDFKCFRLECGYGSHYEYLSNYQKTWWLASDKKEKPNDN